MIRALLFLVCCQAVLSYDYYDNKPSTQQFQRQQPRYWTNAALVSAVQNRTSSWTAGSTQLPLDSFHTGVSLDELENTGLKKGVLILKEDLDLPEHFDAREKWSQCPSLREVRNQGCCGACWAVSAASIFTDRWCIHSPEHEQFYFGSNDLISCCHACGKGCQEGTLGPVWTYWVKRGVSSGGPFNSKQGCRSYPFDEQCTNPDSEDVAPRCSEKCQTNYKYKENYQDRRFGRVAYAVAADETKIMEELFVNGPVQAAYTVYTDFLAYKSGVYHHVAGSMIGSHAVKILGWGVENGVKYWLCANSWGNKWGQNGFFKIVRGQNHLGIESYVHAGLPHYDQHDRLAYDSY